MKHYKVLREILSNINNDVLHGIGDIVTQDMFTPQLLNFMVTHKFLELFIPETPEMEVVEGKCFIEEDVMEDYRKYEFYADYPNYKGFTPIKNIQSILIKHPTPLMREVVKQIEAGECYERYITGREIKLLPKEDGQNSYFYLNVTDSDADLHKIIIIPIESGETK